MIRVIALCVEVRERAVLDPDTGKSVDPPGTGRRFKRAGRACGERGRGVASRVRVLLPPDLHDHGIRVVSLLGLIAGGGTDRKAMRTTAPNKQTPQPSTIHTATDPATHTTQAKQDPAPGSTHSRPHNDPHPRPPDKISPHPRRDDAGPCSSSDLSEGASHQD